VAYKMVVVISFMPRSGEEMGQTGRMENMASVSEEAAVIEANDVAVAFAYGPLVFGTPVGRSSVKTGSSETAVSDTTLETVMRMVTSDAVPETADPVITGAVLLLGGRCPP
jgi:hypothetical protein